MPVVDEIGYHGWAIIGQRVGKTLEGLKNLVQRPDTIPRLVIVQPPSSRASSLRICSKRR